MHADCTVHGRGYLGNVAIIIILSQAILLQSLQNTSAWTRNTLLRLSIYTRVSVAISDFRCSSKVQLAHDRATLVIRYIVLVGGAT